MGNNIIQSEPVQKQESEKAQESEKKIEKEPKKMSLKTAIIIVVIIAIGVLAYIYKGLFIAATVNGSPISRLGIIQKLEKASGKNLLESLITEKLVQNEAKAKGISVSSEEINGEIKKIEEQITSQGGTLEAALKAQGMNANELKSQIILQKKMEKLVVDKINVTDEEVEQYIKENKISIPSGQEAAAKNQIKDELRNQKLNKEAGLLINTLKSQAKIQYFVDY